MFLSVKPRLFLNEFIFEIHQASNTSLKAVLKDEKGMICGSLETHQDQIKYKWSGLNDLPYGVYTFELLGAAEESKTRLVKGI